MSFLHNDIATKQRLRDALNEEENMGFQHNDIVTTYAMDKAIAEGGGGGDSGFKSLKMTVVGDGGSFGVNAYETDDGYETILSPDALGTFFYYFSVANEEEVVTTVLYKGDSAIVSPYNVVKSVTGSATYDSETGLITATGDFSVSGYVDD